MLNEKPILFSAPMINAVLDSRKTQTRRALKFPLRLRSLGCSINALSAPDENVMESCPYGAAGGRLWVRESTHAFGVNDFWLARYSADDSPVLYSGPEEDEHGEPDYGGSHAHWWYSRKACPSIHMPRWASRMTLEITGIRVERLQDISEADALAEGIIAFGENGTDGGPMYAHAGAFSQSSVGGVVQSAFVADTAKDAFALLWCSINGAGSWAANPWVWVVEFKKSEPNKTKERARA